MDQGVGAGGDGDGLRAVHGQQGVQDGADREVEQGVDAQLLFLGAVGEDGVVGDLAARAGRGGDGDQGERPVLELGEAPEGERRTLVGEQDGHALGEVDGAAAADRDQPVVGLAREARPKGLQELVGGFGLGGLVDVQGHAGVGRAGEGLEHLGVACHGGVHDGRDPGQAQVLELLAQLGGLADAEAQVGRDAETERDGLSHGGHGMISSKALPRAGRS
jgi:hypothetical protein